MTLEQHSQKSSPQKETGIDPFLYKAVEILKEKSLSVAKKWKYTQPKSIHDKPACEEVSDREVRDELIKAGYSAHLFHTIPEVHVNHQHLRIDNPQNSSDPYILDAAWQQFQPAKRHSIKDPDIMIIKLSGLEDFLERHGIEASTRVDPSIDEDSPYYRYFTNPSLLDPGHLPWLAAADIEKMSDIEF